MGHVDIEILVVKTDVNLVGDDFWRLTSVSRQDWRQTIFFLWWESFLWGKTFSLRNQGHSEETQAQYMTTVHTSEIHSQNRHDRHFEMTVADSWRTYVWQRGRGPPLCLWLEFEAESDLKMTVTNFFRNLVWHRGYPFYIFVFLDVFRPIRMDHTVFHEWMIKHTNVKNMVVSRNTTTFLYRHYNHCAPVQSSATSVLPCAPGSPRYWLMKQDKESRKHHLDSRSW